MLLVVWLLNVEVIVVVVVDDLLNGSLTVHNDVCCVLSACLLLRNAAATMTPVMGSILRGKKDSRLTPNKQV